ncbi:tail protein [Microbacterium phage Armstrong]|uniref:Minor tail protein n=1 Tax=Microbacterium phage Armstrong TaxID=2419971 RepID=A0A3G2KD14_9CAUD|nr:tail protein [Microbacterium phage Armstrong]AYN56904.1 hypothetical protein PBI_ARMSTRONG_18 [Microbacterium phage Armstrong]
MALTAYPFDNQSVTEQQYGDLFGAVAQSGVLADPASNHFKVTAAGSDMNVTVTAVGGASRALLRGHAVLMTASEVRAVSPAASQARVDLVVLRLDYSANTIGPAVKAGTPGTSTPPATTWGVSGVYEIPLATIAVGTNVTTINSGNITDLRRFSGPTAGVWTTDGRPAVPLGFGYNTTLNRWEFTLNGTDWSPIGTVDLAGTQVSGTLPASKGGTGQTSLNATRNALGIGGNTGDPIPVASGGTGATNRDGVRNTAVDLYLQSTAPAHAVGRLWLKTP